MVPMKAAVQRTDFDMDARQDDSRRLFDLLLVLRLRDALVEVLHDHLLTN